MLLHALLTFHPPSSPPCIFFHLLITRNLLLLSFAIAFRLCCQPALHRDVLSSWGFVFYLPGKSPQLGVNCRMSDKGLFPTLPLTC